MRPPAWFITCLALALILLAGCTAASATTESQSLRDKAALEATAIVERAEATAIVLRAQATANAMIREASGVTPTPRPPTSVPTAALTPSAIPDQASAQMPLATAFPTPAQIVSDTQASDQVDLLGVGFAADGVYIIVQFKTSPQVAQKFWQGAVSVTDEATGVVYNDVPVLPIIGPLIARPKMPGQAGYVMLVNTPPGLQSGSLVTVILGDFKQEHVIVQ